MSSKVLLTKRNEPNWVYPFESGQQLDELATKLDDEPKSTEDEALTKPRESSESIIASNIVGANPIEINVQDVLCSVKFLPGGKHVVSAGRNGKIRRWRVADGKEVGKPMDPGSPVEDVTVSRDGKWIVAGTEDGRVTVWNATDHKKTTEIQAHSKEVGAVDISPDSTRIASGSADFKHNVWSLSTGQRLLGPFKHKGRVVTVKFSPDGRLVATAIYYGDSVRVYDDDSDVQPLVDLPICASKGKNASLAWTSNGKQLFILSHKGDVHCLELSTWTTLSKWNVDKQNNIALTPNDRFIATSGLSSFSLWDATSHQRLAIVKMPGPKSILPMAISPSYDIVVALDDKIILRHFLDILPSHYRDNILLELRRSRTENVDPGDAVQPVRKASRATSKASIEGIIQRLRDQLAPSALCAPHDSTKNQLDETVADLEKFVQGFCDQLAKANKENESLRHTIQSLRAREDNSTNQFKETVQSLRADLDAKETSSADLEKTVQELTNQLAASQCTLAVHEQKHRCETMLADGRIFDAAEHLLKIINTTSEDLQHSGLIMNWLEGFRNRCVSRLSAIGDEASGTKEYDSALPAYSMLLSLTPSPPKAVVTGWSRITLIHHSANEALGATTEFKLPRFHVYREICDILEDDDRVTEAVECFQKMKNELSEETSASDEQAQWELDFRCRCIKKSEKRGNEAMVSKDYDAAISCYSSTLFLESSNINDIIVKSCQARASLLEKKLMSATKVIEQEPSNYKGYKRKHTVLHKMTRYREAFNAFEMMLSTMKNSTDPQVCELRSRYLDPTPLIREAVASTIRDIPHVLIDTVTSRLYDKTQQAAAFEKSLIFDKLRSAMTTNDRLDLARIKEEVEKFYQYVMFSHRWQPGEPTFQMVEDISIRELPDSPTIEKLMNFCNLVQSHRFRWAWSDTCCVNQADKGVQQESVVAMFRWYRRAALTIVHLLGVLSDSQQEGDLWRSIWNTRGWTYQEYVASRVIQFYTEDWKPYLGLDIFNHKESPIILSEMEQATKFSSEKLATLQPGLDRVREKLYLASKRQTTREEDIAYSLFGIFNVVLSLMYGEGDQAVGRLLEHILKRSDDVTILAWTGTSGSYHSYLPSNLTVYDQILPPHIPQAIEASQMSQMVMDLQSSFPDPSPIVTLYERLLDHAPLSLASGRLRFLGLVFCLPDLLRLAAPESDSSLNIYRATVPILGEVRIETKDDTLGTQRLVLVHPWICALLDEDFSGDDPLFGLGARALRLLVRLRQPFGALLLASQRRGQYKRVATDSFIQVQIRAETQSSLSELMEIISTVDVQ